METSPNIAQILEAVSDSYNVAVRDIVGKSRILPLPEARAVTCYLASKLTKNPQPYIAEVVGCKRSNVSQQKDRVAYERTLYPELAHRIDEIEAEFTERHPNLYFEMYANMGYASR